MKIGIYTYVDTSYVSWGKSILQIAMCTLDITQVHNHTFLERGSKPGVVTQMQWDTLNCDNHS